MDRACNVVAAVEGIILLYKMPPVFDIRTSSDDLDEDVMRPRIGNGNGVDGGGDGGEGVDDGLEHRVGGRHGETVSDRGLQLLANCAWRTSRLDRVPGGRAGN